jgi:ATP-dependent helicase YprA (DUF1998 family)
VARPTGELADQVLHLGVQLHKALAQLLQAQPDHAIEKRLQLMGRQGRAKLEAPVRHHYDHRQMLHLGVELQEAKALHLQQHNRLLWRALVSQARPKRPIEAMVCRF